MKIWAHAWLSMKFFWNLRIILNFLIPLKLLTLESSLYQSFRKWENLATISLDNVQIVCHTLRGEQLFMTDNTNKKLHSYKKGARAGWWGLEISKKCDLPFKRCPNFLKIHKLQGFFVEVWRFVMPVFITANEFFSNPQKLFITFKLSPRTVLVKKIYANNYTKHFHL